MTLTKQLVRTVGVAAGAVAAVAAWKPDTPLGRTANRVRRRLARDLRYAAASAPGIFYRLAGRTPDPDVSDDILADRIRSSIGPLEKRLDVPHVHVIVQDHVVILHGDVPSVTDGHAIERAVMRVSGVRGLESHLHHGLTTGESRPSTGAVTGRHASDARRALMDAARSAGALEPERAVHAVLCNFADRIPEGERTHLLAHLPDDVRELAGPPRRRGEQPARMKTLAELVAAATAEGGIEPQRAEAVSRAVVMTLRGLVPDEARDVAAVLPEELRRLWEAQPVG